MTFEPTEEQRLVEDTEAPLTNYRIIGYVERRTVINAGTEAARSVPAGSCWHCGTGIAICVQIKNNDTGEVHEIGTTCAERVGLPKDELKRLLAERYAEERAMRSKAARDAAHAAWLARDAAETAQHGEHGTATRYLFGCRCESCIAAAPHGTVHRFWNGECGCLPCLDAAMNNDDRLVIRQQYDLLADVTTGEIVHDARLVETRYGARWRSDRRDVWLPWRPVRRSTLASKGYVEVEVAMLVERCGHSWRDSWDRPVRRLSNPIADRWGERLPAAALAASSA